MRQLLPITLAVLSLPVYWFLEGMFQQKRRERHFLLLAKGRDNEGEQASLYELLPQVPTEVIDHYLRLLKGLAGTQDLPLQPDDHLFRTLLIDQGTLQWCIEGLFEKSGREESAIKHFEPTVLGFIGFLASSLPAPQEN